MVVDLGCAGSLAIFLVELLGAVGNEFLAVFELAAVVVADDVAELGFLASALDANEVIETLIALSSLWRLVLGNHVLELYGESAGVHHLALGITGMHTYTLDLDLGASSIEVLVFEIAQVAAVNGVSPVAGKLVYIEMMSSHTDLLVRVEAYAYVAVLDFVVVAQIAHRLYDFGNTSLVVGSQQSGAVCDDDVFALMGFQLRELAHA